MDPFVFRLLPRANASAIARRGLKSFTDVEFVTDYLMQRHRAPNAQRKNAKRQAESIRSCLEQGMEYLDAAERASLARPTLLYYATMLFAIVEILVKKDAEFRLEMMRSKNAHHGMDFKFHSVGRNWGPESLQAEFLDKGTFPVWRSVSSQRGLHGLRIRDYVNGQVVTGPGLLLEPNIRRNDLPSRVDLLSLIQTCPALIHEMDFLRLETSLARCEIKKTVDWGERTEHWSLVVHPARVEVLAKISSEIKFSPRCIELVQGWVSDNGISVGFAIPFDMIDIHFSVPDGYPYTRTEVLLCGGELSPTEFEIYYIGSYMAGMFARYYPEYWELSASRRDKGYLAISALMDAAAYRVPFLLLEELRREVICID